MAIDTIDTEIRDALVIVIRSLQGKGGYSTRTDSEREKLIKSWATAAAWAKERLGELRKNISPVKANELLEDWEQALSLKNDAARTDLERRLRLRAVNAAREFNQERIQEVLSTLGISSATLHNNDDLAANAGEVEGLLQAALVIPVASYNDRPTRLALAEALIRMLPTHNQGHIQLQRPEEIIVTAHGIRWEDAIADDGNDAIIDRAVLMRQPAPVFDTGLPPARLKSFAPLSTVKARDLMNIQRRCLMSSPRLTDTNWEAGFAGAGVGGRMFHHIGSGAFDTLSTLLDATIDWRDRYIYAVGRAIEGTNTNPDQAGEGANAGALFSLFFYGGDGTTDFDSPTTFAGGTLRVTSAGELHWAPTTAVATNYFQMFIIASPQTGENSTPATPTGQDVVSQFVKGDDFANLEIAPWERICEHSVVYGTSAGAAEAAEAVPGGVHRVFVVPHFARPGLAQDANTYVIDASIDWRDRLIHLAGIQIERQSGVTEASWNAWPGLDEQDQDYDQQDNIFFYSGDGQLPNTPGTTTWGLVIAPGQILYADSSDGALKLDIQETYSEAAGNFAGLLRCSGQLGYKFTPAYTTTGYVPSGAAASDPVEARDLNLPQDTGLFEQAGMLRPSTSATTLAEPKRVDSMPLGPHLDGAGLRLPSPSIPEEYFLPELSGGVVRTVKVQRRQRIADAIRRFTQVTIDNDETAQLTGDSVLALTTIPFASAFSTAFGPSFGSSSIGAPDGTPVDDLDWRDRYVRVALARSTTDIRPNGAGEDLSGASFVRAVWYTGDGTDSLYQLQIVSGLILFVDPRSGRLLLNNTSGSTYYLVGMFEAGPKLGVRGDRYGSLR